MKTIVLAAIVAAAMAPAAAQAEDFLGGRIGVVGGWDSVNVDVNNVGGTGNDFDKSYDGFTAGLLTGYHWRLTDGWIIGVGTSTMFSDNSKKFRIPGPTINPPPPGGVPSGADNTLKIEAGRDLEAHVKVGMIASDIALIYAKVGYANGQLKAKAVINGITYEEKDSGSGLRLGLGTEISLNESFSLMAEYRYTDYSNNLKRNQIVAGVGYKF
jgi:outer membrane immunogenic protein